MATAFKRPDGREVEDIRPMKAKVGIVPNADGSANPEFSEGPPSLRPMAVHRLDILDQSAHRNAS